MPNKKLDSRHPLYNYLVRGLSSEPNSLLLRDAIPAGVDDLPYQTNASCSTVEENAAVTPTQGIATDGSHWFEIDTAAIRRSVFATGSVTHTNSSPYTSLPAGIDHLGDGCVSSGLLYIAACNWDDTTYTSTDQTIAIYDATDVSYDSQIDISGSTACNASAVCIGHTGNFFVTSFADVASPDDRLVNIYEFNSSGTEIAVHTLDGDIIGMQGIDYDPVNSIYVITSYNASDTNGESIVLVDTSFNIIVRANPTGMTSGEIEGVCYYDGTFYTNERLYGVRAINLNGLYIQRLFGNAVAFLDNADIPDSGSIVIRGTPGYMFNYNSVWDNNNTSNDWESWIYSDGRIGSRISSTATALASSGTASLNTEAIFGFSWEKSGTTVTYDNTYNGVIKQTQSAKPWVTPPASGLYLGGINASNDVADFIYSDVLVYDKRLSSTEWSDLATNFDNIYLVETPYVYPYENNLVALPDKLFAPELLISGRKPVGEVEIDNDHPLAPTKSDNYFLLQNGEVVDSVTGLIVNSTVDNIVYKNGSPYFNGSNSRIDLVRYSSINWNLCAFHTRINLESYGDDRTIIGGDTAKFNIRLRDSGNVIRVSVEGGSGVIDSVTQINVGIDYDITCVIDTNKTLDGVNTYFLYINGILDATSSSTVIFTDSSRYLTLGTRESYARVFIGTIYFAFFEAYPNLNKILQRANNPYQFLKSKSLPVFIEPGYIEKETSFLSAKHGMPELFLTWRKPVGDVMVDWSNPLTEGLGFASLGDVELITNTLTISGAAALQASSKGLAVPEGKIQAFPLTDEATIKDGEEITFFLGAVRGQGNLYAGQNIFGCGAGLNPTSFGAQGKAGNIVTVLINRFTNPYRVATDVTDFDTNGVLKGDYFSIAAYNQKSDSRIYGFFNGENVAFNNNLNGGAALGAGSDRIQFGEPNDGTEKLVGFFWHRKLSDAEIKSIHHDPYQFLKPKQAPMLLLPAENGAFFSDSRVEMPELLLKNRKPVGEVEIDWDHPLAKGCTMFLPLNNELIDLVSGKLAQLQNPTNGVFTVNNRGVILKDTQSNPTGIFIDSPPGINKGAGSLTIFVNDLNSQHTYSRFFQGGGVGYNNTIIYKNGADSSTGFRLDHDTWTGSHSSINSTGRYAITFSWDINATSQVRRIYINKVKVDTSGALMSAAGGWGTILNIFYNGSDTTTNKWGDKECVVFHDRQLSDYEVKSLHSAPYQFLIPVD